MPKVGRKQETCRPPFDKLRVNGVGLEFVANFAARAELVEARTQLAACLPDF